MRISGKVTALVKIDPPYVQLVADQGQSASATVTITPLPEHPFTIKDVRTNDNQSIAFDLQPLGKDPSRDGYRLVITSLKKDVGSFRSFITIETDLKQKSSLRIPVSGRIKNRVSNRANPPVKK